MNPNNKEEKTNDNKVDYTIDFVTTSAISNYLLAFRFLIMGI